MADEDGRTVEGRHELPDVRGVGGESAQRIGGDDHRIAVRAQLVHDTVPAGSGPAICHAMLTS